MNVFLSLSQKLVRVKNVLIMFEEMLPFRFFFVLVIDGLDSLKKEQQGARDAIRYLEVEFKKSNRLALVMIVFLFQNTISFSLLE